MAWPGDSDKCVRLFASHDGESITVFISRQVLKSLPDEAKEMYFVLDICRRHKLRFETPVGELLRLSGDC